MWDTVLDPTSAIDKGREWHDAILRLDLNRHAVPTKRGQQRLGEHDRCDPLSKHRHAVRRKHGAAKVRVDVALDESALRPATLNDDCNLHEGGRGHTNAATRLDIAVAKERCHDHKHWNASARSIVATDLSISMPPLPQSRGASLSSLLSSIIRISVAALFTAAVGGVPEVVVVDL